MGGASAALRVRAACRARRARPPPLGRQRHARSRDVAARREVSRSVFRERRYGRLARAISTGPSGAARTPFPDRGPWTSGAARRVDGSLPHAAALRGGAARRRFFPPRRPRGLAASRLVLDVPGVPRGDGQPRETCVLEPASPRLQATASDVPGPGATSAGSCRRPSGRGSSREIRWVVRRRSARRRGDRRKLRGMGHRGYYPRRAPSLCYSVGDVATDPSGRGLGGRRGSTGR